MSAASGRKRSVTSVKGRSRSQSHDRGPFCDVCEAPTRNKREPGAYRVCTPCDLEHAEALERFAVAVEKGRDERAWRWLESFERLNGKR